MSDFDSPRHPIDDLAQVIRRYPNRVDTKTLADSIAAHLDDGKPCGGCGDVVAAIIDRINPDRTMGAGALAEAIYIGLYGNDDSD